MFFYWVKLVSPFSPILIESFNPSFCCNRRDRKEEIEAEEIIDIVAIVDIGGFNLFFIKQ